MKNPIAISIISTVALVKLGNQMVQVGSGIRYWPASPDAGPEGWGFRLQFTLLYSK